MNSDQIKGTIDDAKGRVKRQTGEWTGDAEKQVEGATDQIKGKAEKAWGNVKDAAHHAGEEDRPEESERESEDDFDSPLGERP